MIGRSPVQRGDEVEQQVAVSIIVSIINAGLTSLPPLLT